MSMSLECEKEGVGRRGSAAGFIGRYSPQLGYFRQPASLFAALAKRRASQLIGAGPPMEWERVSE